MLIGRRALQKPLEEAGWARIAEAKRYPIALAPFVPDNTKGLSPDMSAVRREGSEYFRVPRGQHPRSTNHRAVRSMDIIFNYSSFAFNDLIPPRPLMIVGSEADTTYVSEEAVAHAEEPKELFLVPGKSHIALYDALSGYLEKLADFMATALCQ